MQLGLQGITYYSNNFPFLNWWQQASNPSIQKTDFSFVSGSGCWSATGGANYLDPTTGELVTPVNAAILNYSRLFYTPTPGGLQSVLVSQGWQWGAAGCLTVDWQGSGTGALSSLGTGGGVDSTGTNTITFHLGAGSDTQAVFRVTPTNSGDPPRNIRIYPTVYKTNINAGEIFNPDWLAQIRQFGRLRFMDWNQTNRSTIVNYSDIATQAYQWWGQALYASGTALSVNGTSSTGPVGGMPLAVICALANQTGSDVHYCIPAQATDACVTSIATFFKNNLNTKLWIEHSNETWNSAFNNGNGLIGNYSWVNSQGCVIPDSTLSIAITNITAGNPTTITVGSTAGFSGFVSINTNDLAFGPLLNNQTITPVTVVNGTTLTVAINTTGAGSYTGSSSFISNNGTRGDRYAGYRSAQIMNIFRTVYGNRARWGGILGTQTATSASVTTNKINAAKIFCTANSLQLTDLFDEVDVTSYVGQIDDFFKERQPSALTLANPGVCTLASHGYSNGQVKKFFVASGMTQLQNTYVTITVIDANTFSIGIDTTGYTAWINAAQNFMCDGTVFQLMDTSAANNISNPALYPTIYTYFNGIVKQALLTGSSNGLVCTQSLADKTAPTTGNWTVQKVVTDANSLALGQYEGGPSWTEGTRLQSSNGASSAQANNYWLNWNWSQECTDVMTATYAQWIGSGPSAKFTECGSIQLINPWPGMRTIPGDINNPSWAAVLQANRGL